MLCVYFSGTGNTRHLAEALAAKLGGDAVSIEDATVGERIAQTDALVLAYPVYFNNAPDIVREFVAATDWRGKRVFLMTTCAMLNGGAIKSVAQLLRERGAEILGGTPLKMPESIGDNALFMKLMPPRRNAKTIARTDARLAALAESLKRCSYPHRGLRIGTTMSADSSTRPKIDAARCNDCGLCRQSCPYAEQFGEKCTQCYRCYANCPQQAITILGSEVVVQYTFPTARVFK